MGKIEAKLLCNPSLKEQLIEKLNLIESPEGKLIFYEIIDHRISIKPLKGMIFISSDEQDVFQTLIYQPLYFVRFNKLEEDLSQLSVLLKYQFNSSISYKINGMNIDIAVDSIIYIESYGHYLTIHTSLKSYQFRENISSIIKKLPDYFIQIHKSYIVNRNMITAKTSSEVTLNQNIILPIGKKYIRDIL